MPYQTRLISFPCVLPCVGTVATLVDKGGHLRTQARLSSGKRVEPGTCAPSSSVQLGDKLLQPAGTVIHLCGTCIMIDITVAYPVSPTDGAVRG